jgi:type IX secretion system PorP/SprF family membrane protein
MRKLIILLTFFHLARIDQADAQDMQFTQYFSAPMYLNPAFTGANVCSRLSSNIRNQWPTIGGGYVSQVLAYDHYLADHNFGLGAMFTNDAAGSGRLRTTTFSGLTAFEVKINRSVVVRGGLQGGGMIRSVNFNSLIFGDQIARGGAATSVEAPPVSVFSLDFSTGFLVFAEKFWGGMAFHHITKPNESLIELQAVRSLKFSLHGGSRFKVGPETNEEKEQYYLSPTFNYRSQLKFDQLDIGCYVSRSYFNLGLWYRGIPGFKAYKKGYPNNDAICILVGVSKDRFNVGYSYDQTISWLRGGTGGAHEISIAYQFCKLKRKKKKFNLVICPKF